MGPPSWEWHEGFSTNDRAQWGVKLSSDEEDRKIL